MEKLSNIMDRLINRDFDDLIKVNFKFKEGYVKLIRAELISINLELKLIQVRMIDKLYKTEDQPIEEPSFGYNPDTDPLQYRLVSVPYVQDWIPLDLIEDFIE